MERVGPSLHNQQSQRSARELLSDLCRDATALADRAGRPDLSSPLRRALERAAHDSVMLCVVGEFKQGKSSLINALLGHEVCPVDDDLATSAVTVVEHSDRWSALVERREGDELQSFVVELGAVPEWVSESSNPDNVRHVDRVTIGAPSPLLARGITLVDTPGAGGLGAGHAAATLGFLPFADALLFVSDASAELSAPEIEFLQDARGRCPIVVMVQTKIDLYLDWRSIAELNRAHLEGAGLAVPIVSVSSSVRSASLRRRNRELNSRSGFPALFELLDREVLADAAVRASQRTIALLDATLEQVTSTAQTEADVIRTPERGAEVLEELRTASELLDHLRGPAARWQIYLNDEWNELNARLHHSFRADLRRVNRMVDDELDSLRNAAEWDDFGRRAQVAVGRGVADLFERLVADATEVRSRVLQLVRDEQPDLRLVAVDPFAFDGDEAWLARQPTFHAGGLARKAGRGANEVVDTLRGAQSGLMILSLLQTVLPVAGMAVLFANPFLLAGLGLWSGGRTMLEQRKRRVAQQRQQVRVAIAKMVDDVSFEVGDQLSSMLRRLQVDLREQLNTRFNQLLRSTSELATTMEQKVLHTEQQSTARLAVLDGILEESARLSALGRQIANVA